MLCWVYQTVFCHVTLTLVGFFGKNVTFERFLVGNEPCGGYLEALLCAGVCFNFWHCITCNSYSLLAFRTDGNLWSLVGNDPKKHFSFSGGKDRDKQGNLQTIFNDKSV